MMCIDIEKLKVKKMGIVTAGFVGFAFVASLTQTDSHEIGVYILSVLWLISLFFIAMGD